jgi:hypothetical protein
MKSLLVIIFLFLVSCKQDLSERQYKSTDEVTGGFNNFSLALHSNGKLELTIKTSVAVEEKEAGTEWEPKTRTVTGKWNLKNEIINYSIDEPESSLDSIFVDTDFNFSNKPIIAFSQKLDTAYIYGIPCIQVEKK